VEVSIDLALHEQVVKVFLLAGFLKGKDALNNNEEDNSHGEHVDLSALVLLALLDFRSHVCHGSTVGLECVDVLVAGKTEIGKF
jgi:hypothetical protein